MDRTLAVVLAGLMIALLPAFPTAQAQEDASLHGQVCVASMYEATTDDPDGFGMRCGQGLPDATLTLREVGPLGPMPLGERSTESDSSGWFFFDGLADGTYELSVERQGFEALSMELEVEGKTWQDVRLQPVEVDIDVDVVDRDGAHVQGAILRFHAQERDATVEADARNGSATVTLLAGHYQVRAEAPGFYAFQAYGMLLDGDPLRIDMKQAPPQTATVRGQVVDQDGAPVAGAHVVVYQYGPYDGAYDTAGEPAPDGMTVAYPEPYRDHRNETTTGADGRFAMHVHAGEVSVQVQKEGHARYEEWFRIDDGGSRDLDIELLRFPEKTAHVVARVTDAEGDPIPYVSVNVQHPAYGLNDCTPYDGPRPLPAEEPVSSGEADAAGSGSSEGSSGSSGSAEASVVAPDTYPYDPGCSIERTDDGFEGMLTPGYAILSVSHDHWRACAETRDADGDVRRDCGPEYFSYTRSLVLPADATTELDIVLRERPGANAVVSGYIVDGATDQAIPDAQIHFSNEETYGWGSADADGDGSYKIRLRGGFHQVSVYADGYLPWQGMLDVPAGGDVAFDVVLTEGEARYGCCYILEGQAVAEDSAVSSPGAPRADGDDGGPQASGESSGEAATYDDLGGGLGPYDAKARQGARAGETSTVEDTPFVPIAMLLVVLAALVLAVRRR